MEKKSILHRLFGTTPGVGVQPKEAIAYSVAGFGQNFICTIIGSYLTVFMTDALLFGSDNFSFKNGAITGSMAVAFVMLFTRIFDACNDPIMGSIVDRTRTKWGKCRPFLKWTPIPIGIITLLCFCPLFQAESKTSFWIVTVIYVIWSVVYTICDVPYWGLSTCLTNNTEVRGNILTVTRLVCSIGAGAVTVFTPLITQAVTAKYKDPSTGNVLSEFADANASTLKWTYFIIALVLVIAAIPMFYYGFKNTKERFTATEKPESLGHNLKLLFKNKQLLLVVLSGVLGGARMVYTYTGGLYFAKYVLKNEGMYSLITMLVVPGGAIASVLVPWLSKKFTKKWAYIAVHLFGGVVMTVMYFVGYDATWKLIVSAIGLACLGIPQGVNNIITYAMIGDTVDYLEWKTGERGEGICFAMQTLINKVGMAVGAFIGVFSYNWAECNPVTLECGKPQLLWNLLVLSGVISMFACTIPMFFYKITEKRQKEMVAEIAERKVASGEPTGLEG